MEMDLNRELGFCKVKKNIKFKITQRNLNKKICSENLYQKYREQESLKYTFHRKTLRLRYSLLNCAKLTIPAV